jgi:hypothetical protein
MSKGQKDNMHMSPEKHPFQSKFKQFAPTGKTAGVSSKPGGEGNKISANAAMKKKRPMQGPGTAK